MWADNETNLDLLGFDFLVDGLVVALTEPRLLPLTIGVLGDWGSGKSSLMRIAARELDDLRPQADVSDDDPPSPYLTIHFSPWQYEDHDDVKIALMTTVLDEIAKRLPGADTDGRIGRLRSIVAGLRRWGRRLGRAGSAAAPTLVPLLLQSAAPDMDPDMAETVATLAGSAAAQAGALLQEPEGNAGDTTQSSSTPRGDVDAFRSEFADLVQAIPQCSAVVVFIDDLDRCLPETVVDTFEAIRLFLNTPKTAYVLALNQNVVESAIDSRYPELKKADGAGIGRDYLEKMLQLKIAIPPLSEPEAETYINLLFAELHLAPDAFAAVLAEAAELRRVNGMEVAFNIGIAGSVLDDIPPNLAADLKWAGDISPILGASLRGNPRQLKRFLNNLLLKYRSATRRHVDLELPILAKLMVLEDQYNTDFQKLFDWEMAASGACTEIGIAETRARGTRDTGESTTSPADSATKGQKRPSAKQPSGGREVEVHGWADKAHITSWLTADVNGQAEVPAGGQVKVPTPC